MGVKIPSPRNKSVYITESCRDVDCMPCWPKTKYIGMKSMTGACSEMPGLHHGDAWCKRYPGYKNGKSTAFIRSVSFGRFRAPGRHRSFDTDSQYIFKLPQFFGITFNSAIYLLSKIIYWKTVIIVIYTENHYKTWYTAEVRRMVYSCTSISYIQVLKTVHGRRRRYLLD